MSLSRQVFTSCRRLLSRWVTPQGTVKSKIHCSAPVLGIFEPDDVGLGPEIPEYDTLNVQMKGYDFVILESFAKYIHNLADRLEIESECWAVPPKTAMVHTYKPSSTVVEREYDLNMYERCVQIQDVPSTVLPVFIEVARSNLPEGIEFTIKEPDEAEEEDRYIPDKELLDLQGQLTSLEQAREERKKR